MKTIMSSAPNGEIKDFFPGTFNIRTQSSFIALFNEIRERVSFLIFGGLHPAPYVSANGVLDLLSGHTTPIEIPIPGGEFRLGLFKLPKIHIDEKTRLLLSDMNDGNNTSYVIDRLSRRALRWTNLVLPLNPATAMVLSPRATKGLTTKKPDPDYFISLVPRRGMNIGPQPLPRFNDVVIKMHPAKFYAQIRAISEPEIPPGFPYVLIVHIGLRICTIGIDLATAGLLGSTWMTTFDIPNQTFGRLLVPGLYDD